MLRIGSWNQPILREFLVGGGWDSDLKKKGLRRPPQFAAGGCARWDSDLKKKGLRPDGGIFFGGAGIRWDSDLKKKGLRLSPGGGVGRDADGIPT